MKIRTEDHGAWRDSRGRKHTEWSAIDDDTYCGCDECRGGPFGAIGRGATEAEAIEDLMAQIEERAA